MWLVALAGSSPNARRRHFVGLEVGRGIGSFTCSILEQRFGDSFTAPGAAQSRIPCGQATYVLRHLERNESRPHAAAVAAYAKLCERTSPVQPWVVLNGARETPRDEHCVTATGALHELGLGPAVIVLSDSDTTSDAVRLTLPRRNVLETLASLFETRRLKLASTIPLIPALLRASEVSLRSASVGARDAAPDGGSEDAGLALCVALPLVYGIRSLARMPAFPPSRTRS